MRKANILIFGLIIFLMLAACEKNFMEPTTVQKGSINITPPPHTEIALVLPTGKTYSPGNNYPFVVEEKIDGRHSANLDNKQVSVKSSDEKVATINYDNNWWAKILSIGQTTIEAETPTGLTAMGIILSDSAAVRFVVKRDSLIITKKDTLVVVNNDTLTQIVHDTTTVVVYDTTTIFIHDSTTVIKLPPVAHAEVSPTSGFAPLQINCFSDGSVDPDGQIIKYEWDFADGHQSQAVNPVYTLTEPGVYNVRLTVMDNDSLLGSDVQVVVVNKPEEPKPTTGSLRVVTTPSGALVGLDGLPEKITTAFYSDVDTLEYKGTVELAGYITANIEAKVSPGQETLITLVMVPIQIIPPNPPAMKIIWTGDFYVTAKKQVDTLGVFNLGGADSIFATIGYGPEPQTAEHSEIELVGTISGKHFMSGVLEDPGPDIGEGGTGEKRWKIFEDLPDEKFLVIFHWRGTSPPINSVHLFLLEGWW
jgi:hypothetical protein